MVKLGLWRGLGATSSLRVKAPAAAKYKLAPKKAGLSSTIGTRALVHLYTCIYTENTFKVHECTGGSSAPGPQLIVVLFLFRKLKEELVNYYHCPLVHEQKKLLLYFGPYRQ